MPRILLTAFEPYDQWTENSSWMALVELTRHREFAEQVVTRRYPVNLPQLKARLRKDLESGFDFALHLGQSPGATDIKLEAIGLNLDSAGSYLEPEGPTAYRCELPLDKWAARLKSAGIPAAVSYHAGTYLCNALLYLSTHYARSQRYHTQSAFVHLPLIPQQVVPLERPLASMTLPMLAAGVNYLLEELLQASTPQRAWA